MLRPVSAGQRAHVAHEPEPGQGVGVPTVNRPGRHVLHTSRAHTDDQLAVNHVAVPTTSVWGPVGTSSPDMVVSTSR